MKHAVLHFCQKLVQLFGNLCYRYRVPITGSSGLQYDAAGGKIPWSEFKYNRNTTALPIEELRSRALAFAVVHRGAHVVCNTMRSLEYALSFAVLAIDWNDHGFHGPKCGWQPQALVIGVAHDQPADKARAGTPSGLPYI